MDRQPASQPPPAARDRGALARNLPAVCACLIGSAAVLLSVPWDADPGWWDASRHAMDGAFYLDLLRDGGWLDPFAYAQRYYARYPAIAPAMYPPLFALVEGLMYGLLGIAPWVARVTVTLFLLAGALGLVRLAGDLGGRLMGAAAGLLFLGMPLVVEWSRYVMLEPAAIALSVWSLVYLRRFIVGEATRDLVLALGLAVLVPYTKQNFVFVFAIGAAALLLSGWRRALDRRVLVGLAAAALAGVPLAYVTLRWGSVNLGQAFGQVDSVQLSLAGHLGFHLAHLPGSVGWPVLALSAVGLRAWWRERGEGDPAGERRLIGAWLVVGWVSVTLLMKEPRHGLLWVPVFAVLAARGVDELLRLRPAHGGLRWAAVLGLGALLLGGSLSRAHMTWSEGLREVALRAWEQRDGTPLLVSLEHEGALIFRLRSLDRDRELVIYRSSKIFESRMVHQHWGVEAKVGSAAEIREAIGRHGIRFLVIEEDMRDQTPVDRMLRETVAGPDFERLAVFDVLYSKQRPHMVAVYRFTGALQDPPDVPAIYLPIVGLELEPG